MAGLLALVPLLAAQPMAEAAQPVSAPDTQPADPDASPPDVDPEIIEGRRRPGYQGVLPDELKQDNPGAVRAPPPEAFPTDQIPVPDRWRIVKSLCPAKGADQSILALYPNLAHVCHSKLDPYHQNVLKGDIPLGDKRPGFLKGDDWFFSAGLISDTVLEPRTFPIPVGVQTTARPQSLDVFGKDASYVFSQTVIASLALTKGNTAFKPPQVEYKLAVAFNYNYADVQIGRAHV